MRRAGYLACAAALVLVACSLAVAATPTAEPAATPGGPPMLGNLSRDPTDPEAFNEMRWDFLDGYPQPCQTPGFAVVGIGDTLSCMPVALAPTAVTPTPTPTVTPTPTASLTPPACTPIAGAPIHFKCGVLIAPATPTATTTKTPTSTVSPSPTGVTPTPTPTTTPFIPVETPTPGSIGLDVRSVTRIQHDHKADPVFLGGRGPLPKWWGAGAGGSRGSHLTRQGSIVWAKTSQPFTFTAAGVMGLLACSDYTVGPGYVKPCPLGSPTQDVVGVLYREQADVVNNTVAGGQDVWLQVDGVMWTACIESGGTNMAIGDKVVPSAFAANSEGKVLRDPLAGSGTMLGTALTTCLDTVGRGRCPYDPERDCATATAATDCGGPICGFGVIWRRNPGASDSVTKNFPLVNCRSGNPTTADGVSFLHHDRPAPECANNATPTPTVTFTPAGGVATPTPTVTPTFTPGGGGPATPTATPTWSPPITYGVLSFAQDQDESVYLLDMLPRNWDGTTITVNAWVGGTAAGGLIVWRARVACSTDSALTYGGLVPHNRFAPWGSYTLSLASFGPASTNSWSSFVNTGLVLVPPSTCTTQSTFAPSAIIIELQRQGTHANDTNTGNAQVLSVAVYYGTQ